MLGALFAGAGVVAVGKMIEGHTIFNQKAAPYRGMITMSANAHGINPHILAALAWQESRFNPNAVGAAGEIGMTQFLPIALADIKQYGFPSHVTIADMKNPTYALEGAALLLKVNRTRTGSIFQALRAYNAGTGRSQADKSISVNYMMDILTNAAIDAVYRTFDNPTT